MDLKKKRNADESFSPLEKKQKTNLKYKEVINLDFSGNKSFGNEGAFELAEELASNTSLTSLKLTDTGITTEGAIKLSEALKSNTSLTLLDLSWNYIGNEGALQLSEALKSNTSITSLDLSWNNLGTEGTTNIIEALKSNSSITELKLRGNNLGTEEAIKLSEALKSNTSITSLDLNNYVLLFHSAEWLQVMSEVNQNRRIWEAIHYVIRINDLHQLMTLLAIHTINLNSFNLSKDGDTILHNAAKSNDVNMLNFILQRISPSTRERMINMYNNQLKLPAELLTMWTPSTHSLFPLKYRKLVKAVLMLGAKRQDGTPYYPQTHFYKLPKDVLFLILQHTALL